MKSFTEFCSELNEASEFEENISFADWIEETPTKKIPALMKEFGFRLLVPRAEVYVKSAWKMVVKRGNLIYKMDEKNPLFRFIVPTEKVKDASGQEWLLQPQVDRANARKAFDEIRKVVGDNYFEFGDLHAGNTGYYKGKPVIFDW